MTNFLKPDQIIKPRYKIWTSVLVSLFLVFFGVKYAYNYYRLSLIPAFKKPGYIYTDNENIPATFIVRGKGFYIRTFTNRIEVCSVDSTYSIIQMSQDEHGIMKRKVVYTYYVMRNRSLVGETITDKYLIVPDWITPGNYQIMRQSDYDCQGQKLSQDAFFDIVIRDK